jgi:hypothetical protein
MIPQEKNVSSKRKFQIENLTGHGKLTKWISPGDATGPNLLPY